jgi:hypothetical protein
MTQKKKSKTVTIYDMRGASHPTTHAPFCPRLKPSRDNFSCQCHVMAWRRIEVKLDRVLSVVEKLNETLYSSKGVMIVERTGERWGAE